jgi:hypothetical protein
MPLWGKSPTANPLKPVYMPQAEQDATYATNAGWVYNRPDGTQELMVAIDGLANHLGQSFITGVYFGEDADNNADWLPGFANAFVVVAFNEEVNVTGSPTLAVHGSVTNATATYSSGSGTSELTFKFTVPAGAQTLSIVGQTVSTTGATVVDTANNTVAANVTFLTAAVQGIGGAAGANATIAIA